MPLNFPQDWRLSQSRMDQAWPGTTPISSSNSFSNCLMICLGWCFTFRWSLFSVTTAFIPESRLSSTSSESSEEEVPGSKLFDFPLLFDFFPCCWFNIIDIIIRGTMSEGLPPEAKFWSITFCSISWASELPPPLFLLAFFGIDPVPGARCRVPGFTIVLPSSLLLSSPLLPSPQSSWDIWSNSCSIFLWLPLLFSVSFPGSFSVSLLSIPTWDPRDFQAAAARLSFGACPPVAFSHPAGKTDDTESTGTLMKPRGGLPPLLSLSRELETFLAMSGSIPTTRLSSSTSSTTVPLILILPVSPLQTRKTLSPGRTMASNPYPHLILKQRPPITLFHLFLYKLPQNTGAWMSVS